MVESEVRGASASGLNLNRKTMGVVYLYGENPTDSAFNRAFSSGFASELESDYFNGEQVIDIFSMPYVSGSDYTAKDTLVNLAMDADKDVIFLVSKPDLGNPNVGAPVKDAARITRSKDSSYISHVTIPFDIRVFVYDTQNKEDRVFGFEGSKMLETTVFSDGNASDEEISAKAMKNVSDFAERAGSLAAKSFLSTWVNEQFYVIYYSASESAWNNGAEHAYRFKWKEAIDDWIPLLKAKSNEKRACAAYNIGLACFMLGQPKLAVEWLDRSDSYEHISLTDNLRKQIEHYTGVK